MNLESETIRCRRIALSALPQGLCLYDRDCRLRLWNEKFSTLYDLDGQLHRGMHLDDVIGLTVSAGKYGEKPKADVINDRHSLIEKRQQARFDQTLHTGTIIEIAHVPLEDGGWLATFEDVTALRSTQRQLVHLANHDQLTGLANRRKFTDVATALLDEARARPATLILIDLDNFKTVNDSMGHAMGDALLKEVARRLRLAAADACLIARLGGDEFALLYGRPIDASGGPGRARAIVDAVVGTMAIDGVGMTIDASFGVATDGGGTSLDALVARADVALYDDKRRKQGKR